MEKRKIFIIENDIDLLMLMEHAFLSTGLYEVKSDLDLMNGWHKADKENPGLIFFAEDIPDSAVEKGFSFLSEVLPVNDTPKVMMIGSSKAVHVSEGAGCGMLCDDDTEDLPWEACAINTVKEEAHSFGIKAVLKKPFTLRQLLALTEKIFSENTGTNARAD
jgi:hypothetical protein